MKHLLFTDFHLKKERLKEQKDYLKRLTEFCVSKGIVSIYFLGDMFDDRKSITPFELQAFKSFLSKLYKYEIGFTGIAGNHDRSHNESLKSYLGIFVNENRGINIIEEKAWRFGIHLFIPYFPEKKLLQVIKENENKNTEYVYMHNAFNGAVTNSGKKMKSILTLDAFKNYRNLKQIFVGHYHERNFLDSKINYIGNAMQLNFGEKDNKGIYIFDDEKNEVKHFHLDYPKFITIKLKCNVDDYQKALEVIERNEGNYVRLYFVDEKEKLSTIPKKDFYNKSKCAQLKIEENFVDLLKPDDFQIEIDFNRDLLKSFLKYSKQENMNKREKKFGIKILRKAMENYNGV